MAIIPNSQKTFSVNEGVNTTYGGSAAMKALSQWYTMQDITDTVRPYQVYTALLTQSGGNDVVYIDSGELTIGVTYLIYDLEDVVGADFTNVGAPNNDLDTYFVATGTTPNSWGTNPFGVGVLQYNTGTPVVTVLENTIGDIWFDYKDVGNYTIFSNQLFTENKTTVITSPAGYIESPADIYNFNASWYTYGVEAISISSYYNNERADDAINYGGAAMLEIRVYN